VASARREIPDGHEPYQKTREFDETTVPAALLANHTTKPGVWALIHVRHGELEYTVEEPATSQQIVRPGTPAAVAPETPHRVRPLGVVSFHVEFWRRQK
jgi:tellurite resistance-related uncharacterized protein